MLLKNPVTKDNGLTVIISVKDLILGKQMALQLKVVVPKSEDLGVWSSGPMHGLVSRHHMIEGKKMTPATSPLTSTHSHGVLTSEVN